ncbi:MULTISPECIES: malto-oligosyltrehalose trehalohydrolase [unclassified Pseudomonas]|uniref:malto-oligosyltrehalose trehalohydrolase n=1 Tax=unclassified Pseudomonas TaxID=196821 RepID=UPI00244CD49E|nr:MULTISPECIES: malto-oligosyltrehalose trehalohydrolase [unclassified Pseudomonas]MDG9927524.1 malto-oligosyltrehalose trehalohydrolase [Pseudomonas sp. GD04042]MDH0484453.1 malto-oligosyltrehalose trehalohydrolase [Pseudomonas sp. GD04015]MDH0602945.1 malto-oligosyltrehalose trehalohydrolase [Pseudomonas sp. GD03869]
MYRHGAQRLDERRTRFALWAPDCREVALELQDESLHPLHAGEDGWFALELECPADTCYRFVVDGRLRVPDPASRRQFGDVHGFSRVVDHTAYAWRHPHWRGRPWHEAAIYELHVGLLGGYTGVEALLPHLVQLGVTALELMPLGEFPGRRNWGYDGVLPFAPDGSYGTPEQLKHLIDSAHGMGLMVFVDVVYNHFGPDGNYLGQYARDFFREDRHTPWGAAIDFRRPQVRDFFCENALMWLLDYRVDGLRLDAVHAIGDDDFLVDLAARVRAAVEPGRHVHLVLENEDNRAGLLQRGYDAQWNDDGHNALHVLLTGEQEGYYADFADDATAQLATCLAQGFVFQGQADRRGQLRGEPSEHLPPSAFVLFLQNHDQVGNRAFGERLAALADEDALKAATLLLLLSPMVPLLFMGEEWGSTRPFLFFTDHQGELADAVREGRRHEFAEFSRFSDPQLLLDIPDPNAQDTFDASRPDLAPADQPRQRAWLSFYRRLLRLRQSQLVPVLEGTRALGVDVLARGALSAGWRLGDGRLLRIDINLSDAPVPTGARSQAGDLLCAHGVGEDDYRQGLLPARSAQAVLEIAP